LPERSSARDAKEDEVRRLKRWAKGKKEPDVLRFHSDILSTAEKIAALGEDAGAEDAPFQVTQWSHYP
jgi:hypothetical protein